MQEEAQGFLDLADGSRPVDGPLPAHVITAGTEEALVVVTGIGMVAAARATTLVAASACGAMPTFVVSAGSCGGMPGKASVGDLIAATGAIDWSADSTSIGYAYGQVPGHDAVHRSDERLVALATQAGATAAPVASANAFAVAQSVTLIAERFPDVVAVDMETAAIAQVCAAEGLPFVALRCVSDMCTGDGGVEFDEHLDDAAARSARATLDLLSLASVNPT